MMVQLQLLVQVNAKMEEFASLENASAEKDLKAVTANTEVNYLNSNTFNRICIL